MCTRVDGCVTRSDEGPSRDPGLLRGAAPKLSSLAWDVFEEHVLNTDWKSFAFFTTLQRPLQACPRVPTNGAHTFVLYKHCRRAQILAAADHRHFPSPKPSIHGALVVGNIVCPRDYQNAKRHMTPSRKGSWPAWLCCPVLLSEDRWPSGRCSYFTKMPVIIWKQQHPYFKVYLGTFHSLPKINALSPSCHLRHEVEDTSHDMPLQMWRKKAFITVWKNHLYFLVIYSKLATSLRKRHLPVTRVTLTITHRSFFFFLPSLSFHTTSLQFRCKHLLFGPIICSQFNLIQIAVLLSRHDDSRLSPRSRAMRHWCHPQALVPEPSTGHSRPRHVPPPETPGMALLPIYSLALCIS